MNAIIIIVIMLTSAPHSQPIPPMGYYEDEVMLSGSQGFDPPTPEIPDTRAGGQSRNRLVH